MSILSRLFGGGGEKPAAKGVEPTVYEGFRIFVEPAKEAGGWRLNARIEKDVDGEVKTHQLIRADTFESQSSAVEATLMKAQQVIDQQGDKIFL